MDWYKLDIDDIYKKLDSSEKGLNDNQIKHKLKIYGLNISSKEEKKSILNLFFLQFKSFIIYVLIFAAILSALVGDLKEFYILLGLIIFIIFLSFFQEYKATKEMESLKKLTPKKSRVIRNNKEIVIDSSDLVPGDILLLTRGEIVPADARIIKEYQLKIDESALTGESFPSTKSSKTIMKETLLADRNNMVFSGGKVMNGHGVFIIVKTGKNTELGKIASMVKENEEDFSPLQKRLNLLGKQFSYIVAFICIILLIVGIFRGYDPNYLILLAIATAVAGIPESFPAIIGVLLSVGMKRMAKKNAIIKKLAAVETLGTCTVICTDKTGTLTQNKMVIENIWTFNDEVKVTGPGYDVKGIFLKEELEVNPNKLNEVSKIIEIGVLCNNSSIKNQKELEIEGEPTEGALILLGKKAGIEKDHLHKKYPQIFEHPFDPDRKCMSSIHRYQNKKMVYSKGAPEVILKKSKYYLEGGKVKRLTPNKRKIVLKQNQVYASQGYRVLGLSYKEHTDKKDELHHVEKDLVFVGLVSIKDPVEENVHEAINMCKDAGIKIIMITGDNPITAKSIANELEILEKGKEVITGMELDQMEDVELYRRVKNVAVFARVTPKHKLRIIKALQHNGEIVGMTGDGVNDAPALKKADIGVAMGKTGTEVAKEASEMVIKDDNFSTIVDSIKEGRTIYNNIQKVIYFLLPGNFAQVSLILIAILAGFLPPLTPLMILFINLVTNDFMGLGLSLEKSDNNIMKDPPRNPKEGILSNYLLLKISQIVPLLVLGTLALFMWEIAFLRVDLIVAQTVAFASLMLFGVFHLFNSKDLNNSIFTKNFFTNIYFFVGIFVSLTAMLLVIYFEPMRDIFGTIPLTLGQWIPAIIVASSALFFTEIQKTIINTEIEEYEKIHSFHMKRKIN